MITTVVEKIGGKVEDLMKKVEKSQKGLAGNLMKGGQAAMVAGGVLEGVAVGEAAAMLKLAENVATAGHAQHDLAEQFGMTAHNAGIWGVVADTVGIDTAQLATGFKFLARNMESLKLLDEAGDAKFLTAQQRLLSDQTLKLNELKKIGNKHLVDEQRKLIANTQAKLKNLEAAHAQTEALRPLQAVFDSLGVKIHDNTGQLLPMNDVMLQIASAFQKMPDGAEKTALALKLFGRSGVDLVSMLNEGSDGIKKFMEQAELSGKVLTDSEAEAAEKAFRANQQLKQAIAGVTTQLALAFLPVLERLLKVVTPWLHNMADWIQHHQKLLTVVVPLVIVITALLGGLLMLGGAVAMIGAGLIMLPTVLAAVGIAMGIVSAAAIPVLIIIGAIALVALALWFAITHWDQIKAIAGQVWQAIVEMGQKIAATFDEMIANVVAIWTEFWKHPLYYVGLVVGFVVAKAIQIHDEVVKWIGKMVRAAIAFWVMLPDNLIRIFAEMIVAVSSWADKAVPTMLKAGQDFGKTLLTELKKIPGMVVSIGADIAKGILKGLTGAPGAIAGGVKDFTGGLLAGIKAAAKIKSPSALFAKEIGVPIALGIAEGIKTGIPSATSALDGLVNASLPGGKGSHLTVGSSTSAAKPSSASLAGNIVEELLTEIRDLLKDGAGGGASTGSGKGSLSPHDVLAAFSHLVEVAQMQRNRGTRAGYVT